MALAETPWLIEEDDRELPREVGFGERDIGDIAAVASLFNMSNRLAGRRHAPNRAYHGQAPDSGGA